MTEPSASALRAYRVTCAFVGVLVLTLGAVHNAAAPPSVDPMWVRQTVFGLAFAVVGATFVSGWARRHVRVLTYGLFHLAIGVFALLCVANAFAPSYAMGMLFVVTVLGLGGGVSSRTLAPIGACIASAVGLTLAGLLWVEAPLVDPLAYAALLLGNGTAVLALVHRRIAARASLAAERGRYRSLFERASDGIYLADADTHAILDANPAYLAMSGYALDEIRRLRIDDVVHAPEGEPPVAAMIQKVRSRGTYLIGPRQHRARDGRLIDVDVSISTIDGAAGGRGVFCVLVRDASRQREVERRLREAADQADEARQRAEELLQLKSSFLSNMSHEIRTPLTGILGYAELLAETVDGDEQAMVQAVSRGARRLMSTLNSVLDLAQLESGAAPIDVGPVDVGAEAEAAVQSLAPLADAKGLALRLDRPDGAVWAEAEAGALARVLNNLVGNAIKFTEVGSVTVSVSRDEGGVRLVVEDTGIGIPRSFLPHLFDEFRQASDGHARRHEGSGLGLAISRRLVEMMGGTIDVESQRGVGTAFTVQFEAAEPAALGPDAASGEGRPLAVAEAT